MVIVSLDMNPAVQMTADDDAIATKKLVVVVGGLSASQPAGSSLPRRHAEEKNTEGWVDIICLHRLQ